MNFKKPKTGLSRILVILLCCALFSCRTHEKIVYLQNAYDQFADTVVNQGLVAQPKDILSIMVTSSDPELSISLNLPLHSYQAGSTVSASTYSQRLLGYLVDLEGCIEFPELGRIEVGGKTREQVSGIIKQKIIDAGKIKEPIVVTEFMNFKISVMGEVRTPGIFYLSDDKFTILEAIARAGDMTIYGRRDNILVQRREQNDIIKYYRVDLRSADIIHSPVFYLQQNDIVYVSPNTTAAARSRINENRTLGVGISLASLLANLILLYHNLK